MLAQALTGPGATLLALPRRVSVLTCLLCGVITAPVLAVGVRLDQVGPSEVATLVVSLIFAGASLASLVATSLLYPLESNFNCYPWHRGRQQGLSCPFTGISPGCRGESDCSHILDPL